ncbi:unnamed protein product [Nezara viridula]|uniref:Uncharacterized protein n=1 Tax=Nezara viridula TaxID=85310 RepID=A0A9P0HE21_NEZVI|nr:unnamed protein product [Nezara viridula]
MPRRELNQLAMFAREGPSCKGQSSPGTCNYLHSSDLFTSTPHFQLPEYPSGLRISFHFAERILSVLGIY